MQHLASYLIICELKSATTKPIVVDFCFSSPSLDLPCLTPWPEDAVNAIYHEALQLHFEHVLLSDYLQFQLIPARSTLHFQKQKLLRYVYL